ncbi:hypothetical protein A2U01_0091216, partial [Trifolium medium]|nr:hypothetical protein [Trifolium medium]
MCCGKKEELEAEVEMRK